MKVNSKCAHEVRSVAMFAGLVDLEVLPITPKRLLVLSVAEDQDDA
jgi:hypothetical protein